jgi:hypothetical protein
MDIMDEFPEMWGFHIIMDNASIHVPNIIDPVIIRRGYIPVYLPPPLTRPSLILLNNSGTSWELKWSEQSLVTLGPSAQESSKQVRLFLLSICNTLFNILLTNSVTASINILSRRFSFVPDQIYTTKELTKLILFFDQFIFKKVYNLISKRPINFFQLEVERLYLLLFLCWTNVFPNKASSMSYPMTINAWLSIIIVETSLN